MTLREELIARYCADRTTDRRNAVVEAHRFLCVRGARKFARACTDRSDLEQVAAVGLIKAAEYYRAELATPFETYAWIMIVGELMHYVRDHERLVRIPRRLRSLEKRFGHFWERFAAAHHREPTYAEAATALGVGIDDVTDILNVRRAEHASLSDLDGTDVYERLARHDDLSIDERIALGLALDDLGDRDRLIVVGTYGAGLTQSQLGERLGLSQSHVSKLLGRALSQLSRNVA